MPNTNDATAARDAMQAAILRMIEDYERECDVLVHAVRLEHVYQTGGRVYTMAVHLEVQLP